MNQATIEAIIDLCRAAKCSLKLDACHAGITVIVTANRGSITHTTNEWLDRNDPRAAEKLQQAIQRVQ